MSEDWHLNYFNYFTEVEEHFQKARGTSLFLMSPMDWALVETWKNSGVPLEAVLRGIDVAFEKWRQKKSKTQNVNSVAYATQAVLEEARIMAGAAPERSSHAVEAPYTIEQVKAFLADNAAQLRKADFQDLAQSLDALNADAEAHYRDLEGLEQRLSALEEKLLALLRLKQSDESLFQAKRDLDSQLRPFRGKMDAAQLSMLERQFLDRRLFESSHLPRLSLFYLA
jgi:hypothetical protein